MPQSKTTTGIFLVILLAVIGYVLVTMPHAIVDGWAKASQISPWVGYIYLAIVGFGAILLGGLLLSILFHIWKNTRAKKRVSPASSMSSPATGARSNAAMVGAASSTTTAMRSAARMVGW